MRRAGSRPTGRNTPNKTGVFFRHRSHYQGRPSIVSRCTTTNSEATKDRTSIGLVFAKEPQREPLTGSISAVRYCRVREPQSQIFDTFEDVHLSSFTPHIFSGKDFTYTAVYRMVFRRFFAAGPEV